MKNIFSYRILAGLVIIVIGVMFLLQQLGIVTISIGVLISTFWPVFLIYVGLNAMFSKDRHGAGSGWWGIIVLLVGVTFLLRNLNVDWFPWSFGDIIRYMWPVIIIIVGFNLLRPKSKEHKSSEESWKSYRSFDNQNSVPPAPPLHPDPTKGPEPYVDYAEPNAQEPKYESSKKEKKGSWNHEQYWNYDPDAQNRSGFIGDIHIGQDHFDLKPLNVSHFIGDTVLDLTKAHVDRGETKINISSFIGDVKVYVPNDFEVGVQVVSSSFIGDVKVLDRKEGGIFNSIKIQSPYYGESDKKIKLIVSTFIGDVRVTKVG